MAVAAVEKVPPDSVSVSPGAYEPAPLCFVVIPILLKRMTVEPMALVAFAASVTRWLSTTALIVVTKGTLETPAKSMMIVLPTSFAENVALFDENAGDPAAITPSVNPNASPLAPKSLLTFS